VTAILTKVEESNRTCRRALEKAGFWAVASMSMTRVLTRPHVQIRPHAERDVPPFLVAHLAR
jgi:hypothetical protein